MLTKEGKNETFVSNFSAIFTISTEAFHTRTGELFNFTEGTSTTFFQGIDLTTNSERLNQYFTEKVFGAVVAVITIYLTAATVCYQIRFGKRQLKIANSICTLAVCALLLRIAAIHVLLYGGHISDDMCNVAMCTSYICFGLNRFLPYVVLWLRQRNLYKTSSQLGTLNTRPIEIISGITLTGIVLSQPALTTLQIIFTRFRSSSFGCMLRNKDSFFGFLQKASPIFFGVAAAFQLVLLGLVLYPIIQQIRKKKFNQVKMKKTVVRLAACTAVCILSDLTFLLAKHLKPPGNSSILTALFSCCDNSINVMAVIASFSDYGLRFVPIQCCKSTLFQQIKSRRTSNSRSSAQRSGSSTRKECRHTQEK